MRTLKFTHEQIEVLKSALIIAETEMAKQAETMYKIGMKDVQKCLWKNMTSFIISGQILTMVRLTINRPPGLFFCRKIRQYLVQPDCKKQPNN